MKSEMFTIVENRPLTSAVFEMTLEGDTSEIRRPGQFVELQLPGLFPAASHFRLHMGRRTADPLYKVVGQAPGRWPECPPGPG